MPCPTPAALILLGWLAIVLIVWSVLSALT